MIKQRNKFIKLKAINIFLLIPFLLFGLLKEYKSSSISENKKLTLENLMSWKNSYTWQINDDSILFLDYENSILFNRTYSKAYFAKDNKKYCLGNVDFPRNKKLNSKEILKPILINEASPYDIYIFKGVTCYDDKDNKYANLPTPLIIMDNGEVIYYGREIGSMDNNSLSEFFNISNNENNTINLAKVDYAFSEVMTFNNDILFVKSAEALNNFFSRNSNYAKGLTNLYEHLEKYINGQAKPTIFNNANDYIQSNDDLHTEYENALNTIKNSHWFIELSNKMNKAKEPIENNINENVNNSNESIKKEFSNEVKNESNNINNNSKENIDFNGNAPLKTIDIKGYSVEDVQKLTRTQVYGLYSDNNIIYSDNNGSFETANNGICTFNEDKKITSIFLYDPKVVYYNGVCLDGLSFDELKNLFGSDIKYTLDKSDIILNNRWNIHLGLSNTIESIAWDVPGDDLSEIND